MGYIRSKLEGDERVSGNYFSPKGLRISIRNLGAFATVIEETLVNHESISGLLGRLSNFDITKMLELAERVISSPSLAVDDLVLSYFTPAGMSPFNHKRVMEAMILGDYDRHSTLGNEFIINLFETEGNYPYSPLLACSTLAILLNLKIAAKSDIDSSHMSVASLLNFFEPCGVARDETRRCLKQLFEASLIAPLDPTDERMTESTKVAITARGHAHLDLSSTDEVYLRQLAMVSGIRYPQSRDMIEAGLQNPGPHADAGISRFVGYLLSDDAAKFRVPNVEGYTMLTKFRNEFAAPWRVLSTNRAAKRQ